MKDQQLPIQQVSSLCTANFSKGTELEPRDLVPVSSQELAELDCRHQTALGIPAPAFKFRDILLLDWLPTKD